jgi:transcriptional regulator with XRE-family HTH domain
VTGLSYTDERLGARELTRGIRQERNLTQEEFAELVGISVDFLSLIERGINAPSFEVLAQLPRF